MSLREGYCCLFSLKVVLWSTRPTLIVPSCRGIPQNQPSGTEPTAIDPSGANDLEAIRVAQLRKIQYPGVLPPVKVSPFLALKAICFDYLPCTEQVENLQA